MAKYECVQVRRITFFFKYDHNNPKVLHIYARHLTTIEDALDVFFNTVPIWNEQFHRYESITDTHGLYWFWRSRERKEITIITCFRRYV